MTDIEKQLTTLQYPLEEIQRKTRLLYEATLRESRYIRAGNFDAISAEDVERLFHGYDASFFDGLFARLLKQDGAAPLVFRVSSRMTSAGGKTTRLRRPGRSRGDPGAVLRYELAVSATLLFQTFREEMRPILVTGLPCADRLEALQRIVEHEMVHLLELLVWQDSSCAGERFRRLANNLFGHTARDHHLVTPRETAHTDFGIRVGDRVSFVYEGVRRTGIVNRITQRATVLVEDAKGQRYSDGKRYLKFYVPLPLLERAAPPPAAADAGAVARIRVDGAGIAWIEGTKTRVIDVVLRKQAAGLSPEALRAEMPHLTLAQVYAALAHYHAHQPALDAEIERQRRRAEAPRTPEQRPTSRRERPAGKKRPHGRHRRR